MFRKKKKNVKSNDTGDEDLSSVFSDDTDNDAVDMGEMLSDEDFGKETTFHNLGYDEFGALDDDETGYVSGLDSSDKKKTQEQEETERKNKFFKSIIVIASIILMVLIGVTIFSANTDSKKGDEVSREQSQGDNNKDTTEGVTVNEQINKAYVGNQNGNHEANGTGAILAFDYAYYVKRSGEEAIKYFNPDVKAYNASTVQTGIDKVSQGTKYELSITPKVIGEDYDVKLKLMVPGYDPIVYNQRFHIMQKDDKFYIKSFNLISSSLDEKSGNNSSSSSTAQQSSYGEDE